ncbi:hypothetical protein [Acetobacterium tundrae]|uniref:Integral membrane protein n=1 Tax=Acetobacterium tundrae TaxID=132932 RepID=A0ABR6WPX8_9FIRM|nr:hypothetical protein [Acetobacterium tundrae]MBC3798555.1 hypothetical protein [Acetobacterium tundrae]
MSTYIVTLLIQTVIETLWLTGAIILVGLFLEVIQKYTMRNFQGSLGRNTVLITGIIGTPIHELSHALFALLFGHKIIAIKLFQRPDQDGVMGYVNHSFNKRNLYQRIGNFFIGVAPILGGILVIVGLMYLLIPQAFTAYTNILARSLNTQTIGDINLAEIVNSYWSLIKTIFSLGNFQSIGFYIFLFLAICISAHMSLSFADIKGSFDGLLFIFLILLLLNVLNLQQFAILPLNLVQYNIIATGILMISVIFSAVAFLISLILRLVVPR